ncbi:MAG: ImmA/IrrE family metallo-endopeptidase [Nevskia sp.]|jgi:Zn-dependent peptidase ImmA (M78 family)|nr:ImmA/IrrE family metallo-endopeptidase [Nevskia sp.]
MSTALINPTLLSWSRLRAGLSEGTLAHSLAIKAEKIVEWETGESAPTFKQAQKWALVAHIPFGFLFLKEPPHEELPLPDLRTVGNLAPKTPSLNLVDTVKDVLRKHYWYQEYLNDHEATTLPFVGRFNSRHAIGDVVADMRHTLRFVDDIKRNPEEHLRALIMAAESAGVLVMRSGIVGGNTHRKLDVGEFRGFAISHQTAPVIFINSADAPTARIFTFVHELAHIWIGTSGVSSGGVEAGRQEESFCNAVAGEFLVPESAFRNVWKKMADWVTQLPELARTFKVSKLVIVRRAYDLSLISKREYTDYYLAELNTFRDEEKSGGSYYKNTGAKNSHRFSKAVLAETARGNLLLRDAGQLLGIQPAKIKAYADSLSE